MHSTLKSTNTGTDDKFPLLCSSYRGYLELGYMNSKFSKKIEESLPLDLQYAFIEFFGKYRNENFIENPIIERSIDRFNTMDLSGTNKSFVKRIIELGLKTFSDELCRIFIACNIKCIVPELSHNVVSSDEINQTKKLPIHVANRYVLNSYFQIICKLISTLDIQIAKDILLDDFARYVLSTNLLPAQVTVEHLKNTVFNDLENLEMKSISVNNVQRFDRFEYCTGIIVLAVRNIHRESYYLIFDLITKKIFMYNYHVYHCVGLKIKTNDFAIECEKDKNVSEDREPNEDEVKNIMELSTNTSTNITT